MFINLLVYDKLSTKLSIVNKKLTVYRKLDHSYSMDSNTNRILKWQQLFRKATDFDSWGQLVEATQEYLR